jgi:hypothetical protein
MMTGSEREMQAFPEVHDVRVEGCSVFKINEKITWKHEIVNKTSMVHNSFFVCLLLFSTCFGQLCAHRQEK